VVPSVHGRALSSAVLGGGLLSRPHVRRGRRCFVPDPPPTAIYTLSLHDALPIYNDYRFDNLVLDDSLQVIGVLDWEMATVGDPLMELGAVLAYWTQADDDEFLQSMRRQPTHLPGKLTRDEVV